MFKAKALTRGIALSAGLLLLSACSGFGIYSARDAQPSGMILPQLIGPTL